MKRKYQFYEKEEVDPRDRVFSFPKPFETNLTEELKTQYGPFLKLVDHQNRIVRIHSAYDSGKGTTIIEREPEPLRERVDRVLRRGLEQDGNIYAFVAEKEPGFPANTQATKAEQYPLVLIRRPKVFQVFTEATVGADGTVGGYTRGTLTHEGMSIAKVIRACLSHLNGKRIVSCTVIDLEKQAQNSAPVGEVA